MAVGPSCWRSSRAQPICVRIGRRARGAGRRPGELLAERALGQVVALLELLHRLGDIGIGDGDAAALHLLQAEALVDQQARHLRGEAVERLRRHGDAGIEGEEPGAADDVGAAHHLAIDDRDDAVGLRRGLGLRRQLRARRQGQGGGQQQGESGRTDGARHGGVP
jgi:hypothetical protein